MLDSKSWFSPYHGPSCQLLFKVEVMFIQLIPHRREESWNVEFTEYALHCNFIFSLDVPSLFLSSVFEFGLVLCCLIGIFSSVLWVCFKKIVTYLYTVLVWQNLTKWGFTFWLGIGFNFICLWKPSVFYKQKYYDNFVSAFFFL